MFPLRVALDGEGECFEIRTRFDSRLGSRNNFAIATGIQSQEQAEWICETLNAAQLAEHNKQMEQFVATLDNP